MPVTYHYHPDDVVVVTFHDPVAFEEWEHAIEAALADPAYSPNVRVLSDRRGVKAPEPAFTQQVVAAFNRRPNVFACHPVAILVSGQQSAAFGMGRMQELLAHATPMNIWTFDAYEDAMRWLKNLPTGDAALKDPA